MHERKLKPDCSFIYLFIHFIIVVNESSTTVHPTTVSAGK